MNELVNKKTGVKVFRLGRQLIASLIGIAAAVIMPQAFHLGGKLLSLGSLPGEVYLPMHLPVILVGLLAGPYAGFIAGVSSPAMSFTMSGMPSAVMLPVMCFELAGYGLSAGLISETKLPCLLKVIISQISGRLVRAVCILAAVYMFGNESLSTGMILGIIEVGIPGIIIQWIILPLLYRLKGQQVFRHDK